MSEEKANYAVAVHEPEDQRDDPLFVMLQRPISFHRIFVDITGSVTAGLMLSQAFYWSRKGRKDHWDGWFFKSASEWEEETGLSRREQESARKRLRKFDWWQEKLEKAHGTPTLHFHINVKGLRKHIGKTHFDKLVKPISTNEDIPVTETTTETTTKEAAAAIHDSWSKNMPGTMTPVLADSISDLINDYGVAEILEAIKIY